MNTILHPEAGIEIQMEAPEKINKLISELRRTAELMTEKVNGHPEVESAWLTSMAHMESIAAYGIKKSINGTTPQDEVESIFDHYTDEMRHAEQLLQMRRVVIQSESGLSLQKNLCSAVKKFTCGFFVHPIIQKVSKNALYAGYIHAALTIEQIPFQMYSHFYLKAKGATKKALTQILKDEYEHLKLGKRLYQQLELNLQYPVDTIQTLEMKMCLQLMNEINEHIDRYVSV